MCDFERMQLRARCSRLLVAAVAIAGVACSGKTEPNPGNAGSNQVTKATAAVDCASARSNAATAWETWAAEIEQEKTAAENSHMNLRIMSEAAAQGADDISPDDESKTRVLGAKATLVTLAALDQAYAPAVAAAREAATELRTPQGANKHASALQQAKTLLDAEQAFDQQSLAVAATTAESIEILDLPAAALDNPVIKAKIDALTAKRAAAIASVEDLRKVRQENINRERKTLADLETAFAPCAGSAR